MLYKYDSYKKYTRFSFCCLSPLHITFAKTKLAFMIFSTAFWLLAGSIKSCISAYSRHNKSVRDTDLVSNTNREELWQGQSRSLHPEMGQYHHERDMNNCADFVDGLDLSLSLGPSKATSSSLAGISERFEHADTFYGRDYRDSNAYDREGAQYTDEMMHKGPSNLGADEEDLCLETASFLEAPNADQHMPDNSTVMDVDCTWYYTLDSAQKTNRILVIKELGGYADDGFGFDLARRLARNHLTEQDYRIIADNSGTREAKVLAVQRAQIQADYAQKRLLIKHLLLNTYRMHPRSVFRYLKRTFADGQKPNEDYKVIALRLYQEYKEMVDHRQKFKGLDMS